VRPILVTNAAAAHRADPGTLVPELSVDDIAELPVLMIDRA
jgi:hypothetical protein